MTRQYVRRCSLCSSEMLGNRPTHAAVDICMLCVLSAEEANGSMEEQFTLGPRLPRELDGGRYSVRRGRFGTYAGVGSGPEGAPEFQSPFPPVEESPTRWF